MSPGQYLITLYVMLIEVSYVLSDRTVTSFIVDVLRLEPEGLTIHQVWRRDIRKENQECKGLKKGQPRLTQCTKKGKYAVQDECRVFLFCKGDSGKPVPTCCPEGLHFDHRMRSCIGRMDAHCVEMCTKGNEKYADMMNASQYLECGSLRVPEVTACPEGQQFSTKENKCSEALNAIDVDLDSDTMDSLLEGVVDHLGGGSTESTAKGKQEADYVEEGAITPGSLPPCSTVTSGGSTTQNPVDCVPDEKMKQSGRGFSISVGIGGGGGGKTDECRKPTKKDKDDMPECPANGNFPIKSECKLYRKCTEKGAKPKYQCCKDGMKFHHVLRGCVEEQSARCSRVCSKSGIRYPHPHSTKKYLECTKKGIPEDMNCEDGKRFDNTIKECVASKSGTKPEAETNTSTAGDNTAASTETPSGWSDLTAEKQAEVNLLLKEEDGYTFLNTTDEGVTVEDEDCEDGSTTTTAPESSAVTGSTTLGASREDSSTAKKSGCKPGAKGKSATATDSGREGRKKRSLLIKNIMRILIPQLQYL